MRLTKEQVVNTLIAHQYPWSRQMACFSVHAATCEFTAYETQADWESGLLAMWAMYNHGWTDSVRMVNDAIRLVNNEPPPPQGTGHVAS